MTDPHPDMNSDDPAVRRRWAKRVWRDRAETLPLVSGPYFILIAAGLLGRMEEGHAYLRAQAEAQPDMAEHILFPLEAEDVFRPWPKAWGG